MPPVLGDGVIYDSLLNGWTGGVSFNGTVFELRPPSSTGGAWTRQLLHAFSGSDGMAPLGGIVVSKGNSTALPSGAELQARARCSR
jgi:hypothetical protein